MTKKILVLLGAALFALGLAACNKAEDAGEGMEKPAEAPAAAAEPAMAEPAMAEPAAPAAEPAMAAPDAAAPAEGAAQ